MLLGFSCAKHKIDFLWVLVIFNWLVFVWLFDDILLIALDYFVKLVVCSKDPHITQETTTFHVTNQNQLSTQHQCAMWHQSTKAICYQHNLCTISRKYILNQRSEVGEFHSPQTMTANFAFLLPDKILIPGIFCLF